MKLSNIGGPVSKEFTNGAMARYATTGDITALGVEHRARTAAAATSELRKDRAASLTTATLVPGMWALVVLLLGGWPPSAGWVFATVIVVGFAQRIAVVGWRNAQESYASRLARDVASDVWARTWAMLPEADRAATRRKHQLKEGASVVVATPFAIAAVALKVLGISLKLQ